MYWEQRIYDRLNEVENRREEGKRMQPVLTMEVRWFYKEGRLTPAFDLQRFRKGDPSRDQMKAKKTL